MTINAEDRDMVYPGNAPTLPQEDIELTAPDNGLGTLEMQHRFVTRTMFLMLLASILMMVGLLALLVTDVLNFKLVLVGGALIVMALAGTFLLGIILKLVYMIRGGTLPKAYLFAFWMELCFLPLALVLLYAMVIIGIQM